MSKDIYGSINLLDAGDMSETELLSDLLPLYGKTQYALHAIYTGSPVGTLIVEVSIDGSNFEEISASSKAVSAAGSWLFDIGESGCIWARIKYTKSSGTGSLSVVGSAKD